MRVTIFLVIYIEVFREYSIAYPQYITPKKSLKGLKDNSLNVIILWHFILSLLLHGPQTCIPYRAGTIMPEAKSLYALPCKMALKVEYLFAFDMRLDQRP